LLAKSWKTNNWVTFFDVFLAEFDVLATDWFASNVYKKRIMVDKLVDSGVAELGDLTSLVEALLNLIVTWNSKDFEFYSRQPKEFNLGYVSKAWTSYKDSVRKNPAIRLAVYNVSTEFTDRIKNFIGEDNPAVWLSNSKPIEWAEKDTILDLDQETTDWL
jgi:hypothetical protein